MLYPWTRAVAAAETLFADPEIDAVALATPLFTYFPLAKAALEVGKHVLVEKPLARSVAECEELIRIAKGRGLALMVDHTFLFTGAVSKIREIITEGKLGRILYFDSVRINLGLFQPDFNVIWDLAPHDLSILDFVLDQRPRWVSAIGSKHYGEQENLAYLTIGFDNDLLAHIHCNWVAPVKTRRTTIAGTDRMLVYDDHHHSGLALLTPADVHFGRVNERVAARQVVLSAAYYAHPERFPNGPPIAKYPDREVWINKPSAALTESSVAPQIHQ